MATVLGLLQTLIVMGQQALPIGQMGQEEAQIDGFHKERAVEMSLMTVFIHRKCRAATLPHPLLAGNIPVLEEETMINIIPTHLGIKVDRQTLTVDLGLGEILPTDGETSAVPHLRHRCPHLMALKTKLMPEVIIPREEVPENRQVESMVGSITTHPPLGVR
jgi:hypothetical protein